MCPPDPVEGGIPRCDDDVETRPGGDILTVEETADFR